MLCSFAIMLSLGLSCGAETEITVVTTPHSKLIRYAVRMWLAVVSQFFDKRHSNKHCSCPITYIARFTRYDEMAASVWQPNLTGGRTTYREVQVEEI